MKARLLRLSIVIGIVAIISSLIGLVIHSWNYPPLTVGDVDLSLLEYTSPEFLEKKDGGRFVVQAIEASSDIDFYELKNNWGSDWTMVATTVDVSRYAHVIERLHRASEYEVCHIPLDTRVFKVPDLARAWLIQGAQAALRGDDTQAIEIYFRVFDLGTKFTMGHNTLIVVTIGMVLQGAALDAMKDELQAHRLRTSTLNDAITKFQNYQVNPEGVANALRIEYRESLTALAEMETHIRQNPFKRLFYDSQQTHEIFANCYARLIRLALMPPSKGVQADSIGEYERLEAFFGKDKGPSRYFRWRNSVGLEWLSYVLPRLTNFAAKVHRISWNLSAVSALYRLKRFQQKKGRLPKTLTALAAYDSFPVPYDPIADAPLGYSPTHGVIYSTVAAENSFPLPSPKNSEYRISLEDSIEPR